MPSDPLEARAFGPSIYRAARLLYNENPPTSKLNETPVIPDSSYAGTKTTLGRASVRTYKRSFRRDFCSGANALHRADLESGESRIGVVPHFGEV